MIGKGRTGSSFGGLQSYLLKGQARDRDAAGLQEYLLDGKSGRDRVEWTSTRNLPTEDPRYAAAVMRATAEQNPRVQKPVYHLSLSASPGEQISKEKWERIADRVLTRLGLDDRQALVVAHNDTRHPHIHLMVNRVHPEHLKAWHNGHDYRRIEKALRHIERDLKLREVPGHHYQLAGQQAPERARTTDGERRQAARTGEPPWADRIRFKIYDDLKQAKSWGDLERRLAGHRLRLERRGGGLVITDGKNRVKASRVYRARLVPPARGAVRDEVRGVALRAARAAGPGGPLPGRSSGAGSRPCTSGIGRHGLSAKPSRRWSGATSCGRPAATRRPRSTEHLRQLYRAEDLPAVRRRLVAEARRHGWAEAGRRLAERPRQFGRLRVSWRRPHPLMSRRQFRRFGLQNVMRYAANLARFRSARLVAGPVGYRAAAALLDLRRSWQRAHRLHEAAPYHGAALKEIGAKAVALGVSSVSLAVAPNPLKVIRTAVRAVELAREVGRGMER